MSQGPLCPNLTQKVQKEVSQMANCNLSCIMLLGGLYHLKRTSEKHQRINGKHKEIFVFMFAFTQLNTFVSFSSIFASITLF